MVTCIYTLHMMWLNVYSIFQQEINISYNNEITHRNIRCRNTSYTYKHKHNTK